MNKIEQYNAIFTKHSKLYSRDKDKFLEIIRNANPDTLHALFSLSIFESKPYSFTYTCSDHIEWLAYVTDLHELVKSGLAMHKLATSLSKSIDNYLIKKNVVMSYAICFRLLGLRYKVNIFKSKDYAYDNLIAYNIMIDQMFKLDLTHFVQKYFANPKMSDLVELIRSDKSGKYVANVLDKVDTVETDSYYTQRINRPA